MSTEHDHPYHVSRHASERARLTTIFLVGVLALQTFLLSVGLSHPKKTIEFFIYASYIVLGLGLLVYEFGNIAADRAKTLAAADVPKDEAKKKALAAKQAGAIKTAGALRRVQQGIFILSIIAVVGFGISTISLFFPATSSATPTSTSATQ